MTNRMSVSQLVFTLKVLPFEQIHLTRLNNKLKCRVVVHPVLRCPSYQVARAGLEPAHLAAQASKTCMSANSITGPHLLTISVPTVDDNSFLQVPRN
jgi:hypothetical protein